MVQLGFAAVLEDATRTTEEMYGKLNKDQQAKFAANQEQVFSLRRLNVKGGTTSSRVIRRVEGCTDCGTRAWNGLLELFQSSAASRKLQLQSKLFGRIRSKRLKEGEDVEEKWKMSGDSWNSNCLGH